MSWNFDNILKADTPNAQRMGFDGRDVWVSLPSSVSVYGYWDENANYEGIHGEYFPDFFIPAPKLNLEASINLSAYISGSESLDDIVKIDDHMYVAVIDSVPDVSIPDNDGTLVVQRWKLTKLIKVNITTKAYVATYTMPANASYNITAQNNKIWFATLAEQDDSNDDSQKLHYFNTLTNTTSAGVDIPGKKQFQYRVFANGRNTWVLVGNNNSNSIMKFNDSTGAFVSEVLTNRDPSAIYVNGSREAIVGSADGMVSVVNQTTDNSTNLYTTLVQPSGIVDDGTHLWSMAPSLIRTTKNTYTDNIRLMTPDNVEDYALLVDKFDEVAFTQLLMTPQFDYQWWNGVDLDTRTVKSYVFCLSTNKLQAFRVQAIYRTNVINVKGGSMISTGSESYYGETTK